MPHWRRNGTNICSMYQHDQFDLPNNCDQYQSLMFGAVWPFFLCQRNKSLYQAMPPHGSVDDNFMPKWQTVNRIVTLLYASLPNKNNNNIIIMLVTEECISIKPLLSDRIHINLKKWPISFNIASCLEYLLIWGLPCIAVIMGH